MPPFLLGGAFSITGTCPTSSLGVGFASCGKTVSVSSAGVHRVHPCPKTWKELATAVAVRSAERVEFQRLLSLGILPPSHATPRKNAGAGRATQTFPYPVCLHPSVMRRGPIDFHFSVRASTSSSSFFFFFFFFLRSF